MTRVSRRDASKVLIFPTDVLFESCPALSGHLAGRREDRHDNRNASSGANGSPARAESDIGRRECIRHPARTLIPDTTGRRPAVKRLSRLVPHPDRGVRRVAV